MSVSVSSLPTVVTCTWPTMSWPGASSNRSVCAGEGMTGAGGGGGGAGAALGTGLNRVQPLSAMAQRVAARAARIVDRSRFIDERIYDIVPAATPRARQRGHPQAWQKTTRGKNRASATTAGRADWAARPRPGAAPENAGQAAAPQTARRRLNLP